MKLDVRKNTSFTFPFSFRKFQAQLSRIWIEIKWLLFSRQVDGTVDWFAREDVSTNQLIKVMKRV